MPVTVCKDQPVSSTTWMEGGYLLAARPKLLKLGFNPHKPILYYIQKGPNFLWFFVKELFWGLYSPGVDGFHLGKLRFNGGVPGGFALGLGRKQGWIIFRRGSAQAPGLPNIQVGGGNISTPSPVGEHWGLSRRLRRPFPPHPSDVCSLPRTDSKAYAALILLRRW